jgi:hypothetical protein
MAKKTLKTGGREWCKFSNDGAYRGNAFLKNRANASKYAGCRDFRRAKTGTTPAITRVAPVLR